MFKSISADVDFRWQVASRAVFCDQVLLDRNVCLRQRLEFFDAVVTPAACFAAGHKAIFHADIRQFDAEFRRLSWRIVGPPAGVQWNLGRSALPNLGTSLFAFLLEFCVACCWHGSQSGNLFWVDPAICGHLVSRHLFAGNDGTAGKEQLETTNFGISRAMSFASLSSGTAPDGYSYCRLTFVSPVP